MKVLLIGSGGRESSLAWKISQSSLLSHLYIAPGNPGTDLYGVNIDIKENDVNTLLEFATVNEIDITIVGPEVPLALGIVDLFNNSNLKIFGPTKLSASLESSKSFAKKIMETRNIPTAFSQSFDNYELACQYVNDISSSIVVKADGLASGKGVYVCNTKSEALEALKILMIDQKHGLSGSKVLLEECLYGWEASVFVFSDGYDVSDMVVACDHKRIGNGDTGPNTGGMGAFSPPHQWDDEIEELVKETIVIPVIDEMRNNYDPYVGVLFVGLMITNEGPKVIEFNCRFGDPETQVILPLLDSDILSVIESCVNGTLSHEKILWSDSACVCVVAASEGYPNDYKTGHPIAGINLIERDVNIFYAGTESGVHGDLVTSGGRVLSVSAVRESVSQAANVCYENIGKISYQGIYYRNDIARQNE